MLDYTLLEFEEAVPFLGESCAPAAAINAPPQREGHNRVNIATRPYERETNRMARDPDRKPRPREQSAERPRSQSRTHAPAPRGVAGNTENDACFHCGKIGVKSGHPGCASPNEQNDKGKATLAAYKKARGWTPTGAIPARNGRGCDHNRNAAYVIRPRCICNSGPRSREIYIVLHGYHFASYKFRIGRGGFRQRRRIANSRSGPALGIE